MRPRVLGSLRMFRLVDTRTITASGSGGSQVADGAGVGCGVAVGTVCTGRSSSTRYCEDT